MAAELFHQLRDLWSSHHATQRVLIAQQWDLALQQREIATLRQEVAALREELQLARQGEHGQWRARSGEEPPQKRSRKWPFQTQPTAQTEHWEEDNK